MAEQRCAVCDRGGFWVGYDSTAGEDRCVNHTESDRLKPDDATVTIYTPSPVLPNSGAST